MRTDDIGADGLRGPPDGRVAVAYELCIPDDPARVAEVRRIDPSIEVHAGSSGRVGCSAGERLAIGSTAGADWRARLRGLSELRYVQEIREAHLE